MFRRRAMVFLLWGILALVLGCSEEEPGKPLLQKPELSRYTQKELQELAPTELHRAVLHRNLDMVEKSSRHGEDINARNHFGQTPLALALKNRTREIARYLVKFPTLDIYSQDADGNGYFLLAAAAGFHEIMQDLILRHSQHDGLLKDDELSGIDLPNSKDERALHYVTTAETAEVIRRGWGFNNYDILHRDVWGRTGLHTAAMKQRTSVIRWAAEKFCSEEWEDLRGSIIGDWFGASTEKSVSSWLTWVGELVRRQTPIPETGLLTIGRWAENPVNMSDSEGNTILHLAIQSESRATVEAALTCQYIDTTKTNNLGQLPLHWACRQKDHLLFTKVLTTETKLVWGSPLGLINRPDNEGNTPMHVCALNGDPFFYQTLLQLGGNSQVLNKSGQSPHSLFTQRQNDIRRLGTDKVNP